MNANGSAEPSREQLNWGDTMAIHIVEIHVRREMQCNSDTIFNDVGIVVPAHLDNPKVEDGDVIEFHYCLDESTGADKRVTINFHKDWSKANANSLEVAVGNKVTWISDQGVKGASGKMKYMVYCHSIGEYAVGDSPPDMVFHP